MGTCIYSHDDGAYCDKHDHGAVTVGCCGEDKCPDRKALTNADRIRAMTDEELADFELGRMCCPPGKPGCEENNLTCDSCYQCWLKWLKQEAENEL